MRREHRIDMDKQEDQRTTHTHAKGHESHHGVYVCPKCGWPFPNPHPSSKQRRAHKKICGTIQGYKLLVSEHQNHSNASDDEQHLSDDDPYTQGPNSLDTGNNEKVNGGTREFLTRSGDEVFLDAIANFSDAALSPGNKENLRGSLDLATDVEIVHRRYQEFSGSSEFNDVNQLIAKSIDDGQTRMQHPSILQRERVKVENMLEFQSQLSGSHVSSSVTDLKTVVDSDDYFVLSNDSNPSKAEAIPDMLLENKIYAAGNVRNCSLTSVEKETKLEENEEIKSDSDMIDIIVFSDNNVGEEMLETAVSDVVKSDCQVASDLKDSDEKNNILINQSHLSRKREVLPPYGCVLGSIMKEKENCELVAEEIRAAEESFEVSSVKLMIESDKRSDEIRASMNGMKIEMNEISLPQGSFLAASKEDLSDIGISLKTLQLSNQQLEVKPSSGAYRSDDVVEMDKFEKCDAADGPYMERPIVKDSSLPKPADSECPIFQEVVMNRSASTRKGTECANRGPLSSVQEDIKDNEINSSCRVNKECNSFISTSADSHETEDAKLVVKVAKDLGRNFSSHNSLNTEPSPQYVSVVEDTQDGEHGREVSEITAVPVQDQSDTITNVHLPSSAIHTSIDYGVQCDSLEGNPGPVSEAGESNLKDPKAASKRQQCEKPEMFEPPSFMTLVEPEHMVAASEAQNGLNQHPSSTSSQAGWFPTITQVTTNESQGRKRNEEIIAKITNYRTSKQFTPLQSPLSEAALSNKPESPKLEETLMIKKNGESPAAKSVKGEGGKGWNSPARYPADIKNKNKKVKSKPYWIPFVCCSSRVDSPRR